MGPLMWVKMRSHFIFKLLIESTVPQAIRNPLLADKNPQPLHLSYEPSGSTGQSLVSPTSHPTCGWRH